MLDTPGIIPLKLDNQEVAKRLAFVNSVSENAYENEEVANELITLLAQKYPKEFFEYYKLDVGSEVTLENIALARNWLCSNSTPDIVRTSAVVLKDFRDGKIGKFILDDLDECID